MWQRIVNRSKRWEFPTPTLKFAHNNISKRPWQRQRFNDQTSCWNFSFLSLGEKRIKVELGSDFRFCLIKRLHRVEFRSMQRQKQQISSYFVSVSVCLFLFLYLFPLICLQAFLYVVYPWLVAKELILFVLVAIFVYLAAPDMAAS